MVINVNIGTCLVNNTKYYENQIAISSIMRIKYITKVTPFTIIKKLLQGRK